jgi:hypothetical protein
MTESRYDQFLSEINQGPNQLATIYHAVRNIPYGSVGERDPLLVMKNRSGSCSGKHILLRNLLRKAGYQAGVMTILTHFDSKLKPNEAFPPELNLMIEEGGICDYHHYVRVGGPDGQKLDATWQDTLSPYGFPVNSGWDGEGDTELASVPIEVFEPVEDLIAFKIERINSLPKIEADRRSRFFDLLTGWITKLGSGMR